MSTAGERTGRCTVLLVEDDDSHAKLIIRCIDPTAPAPDFVRMKSGEEALDYLRRRGRYAEPDQAPPAPDVVLVDLRLPRMSGLELLEAIRSDDRTRDLPVVVVSTSAAQADVTGAEERGASGYVVKSGDPDKMGAELERQISRALRRKK